MYIWNDITESFNYRGYKSGLSTFWFDNKFSTFHQIGLGEIDCYVENFEFNQKDDNFIFECISKGRSLYTCIISIQEKTIKLIFDLEGDTYMSVYYITEAQNE